jgi:integrase
MATKKKRKLPEGIREVASGRYQARYPVVHGGVTKLCSAGTFASVQDAKDARALAVATVLNGTWVDPAGARGTVAAWATEWVELRGTKHTRTAQSFLAVHILPAFGACKLGDITPMDVQRWVNHLQTLDLVPTTVLVIYRTFAAMMGDAVDFDQIGRSPCRRIVLPKAHRTTPTPLSLAQLRRLEDKAPSRYAAMIHLSAWCGLRWGELAALRWENVDLSTSVIKVCEAVKTDGSIGPPKNGKPRDVPMSLETVEVLKAHRRDWGTNALLFPGQRNERVLNYSSFRRHIWYALIQQCGLDSAPTFHDLRHAYIAHMARQGVDWKLLAEVVGHSTPSFTMNRYGWARQDGGSVIAAAASRAMTS